MSTETKVCEESPKEKVLKLIRCSLWGENPKDVILDNDTYKEMKKQTIAALPAAYLSQINLSPDLYRQWQMSVLQQLAYYTNYKHMQEHLPITVPYVILKGTAAAQYYPNPEHRTMGDIDIIVRREDFNEACRELTADGYRITKKLLREVGFTKNGIMVEVHRYFASLNDPEQAKFLDDLIISNIGEDHVLPDPINGLVLLEHISQHLENGLGFRQIIDWMMFVDKCLPDDKWPAFYQMAERIGMTKLAIAVTRMCELFLGLPKRKWCAEANERTCEKLLEYVYSSGNFGNKENANTTTQSVHTMYKIHSIKAFFQLLQSSGVHNWKKAQENAFLRKFAWLYQIGKYVVKGLGRKYAFAQLRSEYHAVQERKELFDAIGVKQLSKGLVVYKDGEYKKK